VGGDRRFSDRGVGGFAVGAKAIVSLRLRGQVRLDASGQHGPTLVGYLDGQDHGVHPQVRRLHEVRSLPVVFLPPYYQRIAQLREDEVLIVEGDKQLASHGGWDRVFAVRVGTE
jgi:hypothetical protein